MDAASNRPEPTIGRELIAGLLGTAVALGCVMPPLLHLVTGPLGPFIGGFIVAHHVRPGPRGRAIIAVTIGLGLSGLGAAAAWAISSFAGPHGPPKWFPQADTLGLILFGVWLYASALGGLGATVGATFGSGEASE